MTFYSKKNPKCFKEKKCMKSLTVQYAPYFGTAFRIVAD